MSWSNCTGLPLLYCSKQQLQQQKYHPILNIQAHEVCNKNNKKTEAGNIKDAAQLWLFWRCLGPSEASRRGRCILFSNLKPTPQLPLTKVPSTSLLVPPNLASHQRKLEILIWGEILLTYGGNKRNRCQIEVRTYPRPAPAEAYKYGLLQAPSAVCCGQSLLLWTTTRKIRGSLSHPSKRTHQIR